MEKVKNKVTYVVVVDEQLDEIFDYAIQLMIGSHEGMRLIRKHNLEERMKSFLGEIAEKCHDLGWCKDPNCVDKQR